MKRLNISLLTLVSIIGGCFMANGIVHFASDAENKKITVHGNEYIESIHSNTQGAQYSDLLEEQKGLCIAGDSIVPYISDSNNSCDDYCNTHGEGREKGGTGLLNSGCRNYMGWAYGNYGVTNIPYWINMSSFNTIADVNKRNKLIEDIRTQTALWNEAQMYDGTGQIVNLYEVGIGFSSRPDDIGGQRVVEVLRQDGDYAGQFSPSDMQVRINYNENGSGIYSGRNIDTIMHEFGHVLGLMDLDYSLGAGNYGTHKVLMGYNRDTTEETLNSAIKYQDIQGIAVLNNRHTEHSFFRYVKNGNKYLHICFYCDKIDNQSNEKIGSAKLVESETCSHTFALMVSHRNRYWVKCTRCYKVLETDSNNLPELMQRPELSPLFGGGTGMAYDPFLIANEQQFRNMEFAHRPVYITYQGYEEQINYYFKLTNNITLNGDWTAFSYKFSGEFDGGGYSVTYSTEITQGDLNKKYFGLFGFVVSPGKIKNLHLRDCRITSDVNTTLTCSAGNPDIGILAGSIYEVSKIENIVVTNPYISCNIENAAIGGIAGTTHRTSIINCTVSGGNIISYSGQLGGMAGLGDIGLYKGGSCNTTITKNNYSDSDLVGEIVGNSQERSNVLGKTEIETDEDKCIAAGTLITLADGRQVPVETLTGNEMLLVWNLQTGSFDTAPILFIDSDPVGTYKVIDLAFSDGTSVKVIYEHGFWDYDLNKYVYLREDAAQYIGHWFNKQTVDENGNFLSQRVQLTGVDVRKEYTATYSPVTYGHLCYYVNGMLSMPGGIGGLFNTFEVDAGTMKYDEAQMQADIEEYGLFTYEEFYELVPVTEQAFNAFNGQFLKVAVGKGLTDFETLNRLAVRYAEYLGEA